MEKHNGKEYAQNYDIIVKWMAEALRGETLEVIGVKTGRIQEVFGFEPVDISVRAGRVDVMLRDDRGALYHLEEQRDLTRSDLHRFAAYHFLGAKQWGMELTDIILASGEVFAGEKKIATKSGTYSPIVIDFTLRDGRKRLAEIREAAESGTWENCLELVFLPLCGKEDKDARAELAEQVLRFETELFHAGKISSRLMAATLILSNKIIDKERLSALWEEIKMLDILEIAREKGLKEGLKEGKAIGVQEGKAIGVQEGSLQTSQEMLTDMLIEKFGAFSLPITERILAIGNPRILKILFKQALKCKNIQEFETVMQQMV
ncbi:MAG: hypothetical protein R2941_10370 [Desulfobacterales bacterium]